MKNFNVKLFANADANANANTDAGGRTIALPGLRIGELIKLYRQHTGFLMGMRDSVVAVFFFFFVKRDNLFSPFQKANLMSLKLQLGISC